VLLAVVLCPTIGSVINAGPQAVKDTFKTCAAIYGGCFFSGAIYATKVGRDAQKKLIQKARKNNDPIKRLIVTHLGKGNPILAANRLMFKHIARTTPLTLPLFVLPSYIYHIHAS